MTEIWSGERFNLTEGYLVAATEDASFNGTPAKTLYVGDDRVYLTPEEAGKVKNDINTDANDYVLEDETAQHFSVYKITKVE
ncbi:hypothetical protein SEA_JUMBO_59 [Gordonia phage Jumbo]|uniref:Uncharacterized protein n=1 Tax=Gordonia phage Jumbo TaxID=1887650 RepID=A0A1B3B0L6_9CAUD|nr:hypothetical protein BIZ69_gp059 [Gordonia phage Jumbo]AOE44567.1 hypothetical protein SEA_JUMBO_59 [Gordonia phage Jumbo]